MFCEGVKGLLAETRSEVGCVLTSLYAVGLEAAAKDSDPLIIVGVRHPNEIVSAVRDIKLKFAEARIVVMDDVKDVNTVLTALDAGANCFVPESTSKQALVNVLELVTLNEPVMSVALVRLLLATNDRREGPARSIGGEQSLSPDPLVGSGEQDGKVCPRLSSREAAILNSLVGGLSNKVIAHQLTISEATVKVHIKAILRKIRVKNRTQAAIWAMTTLPTAAGKALGGDPPAKSQPLNDVPAIPRMPSIGIFRDTGSNHGGPGRNLIERPT